MRKFAVVLASAAALSFTQAHAADPGGRQTIRPYAPFFNWSGFYFGGHAGGAWTDIDWTFFNGAVAESFSQSHSTGIWGAQGGFQFQFDTLVVGLEVSYSANFNDDFVSSAALLAADRSRDSRLTDLLMVTPRLGFAYGPAHVYIKGGYATADVDFQGRVTSTGVITATSGGREHGWTFGGGVEYALWQSIVLGLQYDYVNLSVDDRVFNVSLGFLPPNNGTGIDVTRHMVTGRINFLFNPW